MINMHSAAKALPLCCQLLVAIALNGCGESASTDFVSETKLAATAFSDGDFQAAAAHISAAKEVHSRLSGSGGCSSSFYYNAEKLIQPVADWKNGSKEFRFEDLIARLHEKPGITASHFFWIGQYCDSPDLHAVMFKLERAFERQRLQWLAQVTAANAEKVAEAERKIEQARSFAEYQYLDTQRSWMSLTEAEKDGYSNGNREIRACLDATFAGQGNLDGASKREVAELCRKGME